MFGTLGGPEILLILVIALIVFGPRRLPDIGKSLGKMMVEFRRASNDFRRTVEEEVEADKVRQSLDLNRLEAPRTAPEGGTSATPAPAAGGAASAAPTTESPAAPSGTVAQGSRPPAGATPAADQAEPKPGPATGGQAPAEKLSSSRDAEPQS